MKGDCKSPSSATSRFLHYRRDICEGRDSWHQAESVWKTRSMRWHAYPQSWSLILRRYLPALALCSVAWEVTQLPLYTLWAEGRPAQFVYAVAHCTAGDLLIGLAALIAALTVCRAGNPGHWPLARIALLTTVLAVIYTTLSERFHLKSGSWSYSTSMPIVPWIDVGLSPLLQWILVPLTAFSWMVRRLGQPHP
jgi:hypothetical protein